MNSSTRIFAWDLLIMMLIHSPSIPANKYASSDEKSFVFMQQYFRNKKIHGGSFGRMMDIFNTGPSSTMSDEKELGVANPALQKASQAVNYLRQKSPAFFASTSASVDELFEPEKDIAFEAGVSELEAAASKINLKNLPAEVHKRIVEVEISKESMQSTLTF